MKNKQLNLYADSFALNLIENTLKREGFTFLTAEPAKLKSSQECNFSFSEGVKKYFIAKENTDLQFLTLKNAESQTFIPDENKSEIIALLVTGEKNAVMRVIFSASESYYNEGNLTAKSPEFRASIERLFRLLRKNFTRIPEMRTFYKAKNLVLEKYF